MAVIKSQIDTGSSEFAANDAHMRSLVEDLQKQLDQVEMGGGEKARAKHTKRGKLLPHGKGGTWDQGALATPGILVEGGKVYVFYAGFQPCRSNIIKLCLQSVVTSYPC